MATISKDHLSGSTDGKPISVPINSGTFATVHTGPTSTTSFDEVFIYVNNAVGSTNETVTLRLNGTNNDGKIKVVVKPQETVLVLPGIPIQGNSTPIVIDVGGSSAGSANVFGYVNKIVG
tara:strand:- start:923 stop:1282 length:360 start_codon:yes stop_codon:yes gene_type:complete